MLKKKVKVFGGILLGLSLFFNPVAINPFPQQHTIMVEERVAKKSELEKILEIEPGIAPYLRLIEEKCEEYKDIYPIDPLLVIALLKAETWGFDRHAVSWAAAAGLAQIIPETAKLYGIKAYSPPYLQQAREDIRTAYSYKNMFLKELEKTDEVETYTIKKGDTLESIAKKLGVTIEELLEANPQISNPNKIWAGRKLIIPGEYDMLTNILEYKEKYLEYKKKSVDAFKKYKEEISAMVKGKTDEELRDIDERFIPEVAIDFCVKHLAELLNARDGDMREAVSAYNAGLGAVIRYKGIPAYDETVNYQNKVIYYYKNYKKFLSGKVDKSKVLFDLNKYKGNSNVDQTI